MVVGHSLCEMAALSRQVAPLTIMIYNLQYLPINVTDLDSGVTSATTVVL